VPLAAIVLCFSANRSTNDGINIIFLTKDLIAVFFEVFNFIVSGSVVADVRICGQKDLWWLAG
jgi:hypothetical protein